MRHVSVAMLLTLGILLGVLPQRASAEVYFKETETRYDLGTGLRSKRAIWESVRKRGPKHGGRDAIGTALGEPKMQYRYERNGERCSLSELNMNMHVTLHLPRWPSLHSANPVLKAYYRCIKKTVVVHEREHSRIWYETARKADRKLRSVLTNVSCGRFKQVARKHFKRTIAAGQLRQLAFDREDYARKRYQRCHAITKANLSQSIRFTSLQEPWDPPRARNAPRLNRPAVARTRELKRKLGRTSEPTETVSRRRTEETDENNQTTQTNPFKLPGLEIFVALIVGLGLAGILTWFAFGRSISAADPSSPDVSESWTENVALPGAPGGVAEPGAAQRTSGSAQPTFGKRRT